MPTVEEVRCKRVHRNGREGRGCCGVGSGGRRAAEMRSEVPESGEKPAGARGRGWNRGRPGVEREGEGSKQSAGQNRDNQPVPAAVQDENEVGSAFQKNERAVEREGRGKGRPQSAHGEAERGVSRRR